MDAKWPPIYNLQKNKTKKKLKNKTNKNHLNHETYNNLFKANQKQVKHKVY